MRSDRIKTLFRANLGLAFLAGLFVFWQYIRTSSETGSAVFLGFSPLRLAMLLGVILLLAGSSYLFISSWRDLWWERWGKLIDRNMERSELFWLPLFALASIYLFLFSSEHYLGRLAMYRASLQPILIWFALAAFLAWVSFLWLRAYELPFLEQYRDLLLPSGIAFIVLGVILLFVAVTRVGLRPDPVYWQDAGTPILLVQVWVAWLAGILSFYGLSRFQTFPARKVDLLLCLALWTVACVLWLNQPLTPAYNALEAKAPNFQMYPFGDALRYDVAAHGFLMGKQIPSDFWVKPLYSLFLAVLHLFAKEDFGVLVALQVMLLAFVPVVVYLLTSELAQRPAGVVAGMLVILRERNGIALSNVIEVSHSRLLISDVFSMGLMALLLLLLVKWIKNPGASMSLPFTIGGMLALFVLTRGHPIVLLPLIGCIFLIVSYRSPLLWKNLLLLALGFVLPLIPWFWRNYEQMGKFAFQNPVSAYSTQVAALYSMTPSLVASPKMATETDAAYYERLQKQVFEFVVEHPDELVRFVSAHYVHNGLFSYVYLPHSFQIESLRTYIKEAGFWRYWKGHFTTQGWILLLLNFAVIALGFGGMWRQIKWLTFVPLLIGMGYNLSVSVGRLSGWRLILPADWITLVYYAAGLMQVAYLIHYWMTGRFQQVTLPDAPPRYHASVTYNASVIRFGVLFVGISLFLTYGHKLFGSGNETVRTQAQLITEMSQAGGIPIYSLDMQKFLEQDDAVIVSGQALYPAFFRANSGVLNHYWLSFDTKPYSRVVFYMLGPQSAGVILPMQAPPSTFPDGTDVIVIGCKTKAGNIAALSVVLTTADAPILYSLHPMPSLTCPLPEPN